MTSSTGLLAFKMNDNADKLLQRPFTFSFSADSQFKDFSLLNAQFSSPLMFL